MPLSKIYGFAVNFRNKSYDKGSKSITALPVPVFSIGNISSGGTGKTPFTALIVNELVRLGFSPVIIGRGYKRKSKGTLIVADKHKILLSVAEAGDEMFLLAEETKVPVVISEDKTRAAIKAYNQFKPDCIVLDDGFQHRSLKRDLDFVLVDGKSFEDRRLLPLGRLREPFSSLGRANIICAVNLASSACIELAGAYPDKTFLIVTSSAGDFESVFTRKTAQIPLDAVTVSGIANTERFLNSVKQKGSSIIKSFTFADHHNYTAKDIRRIIKYCKEKKIKSIITTSKDAVKLRFYSALFAESGLDPLVLKLIMNVMDMDVLTNALLGKLSFADVSPSQ